MANLKKALVYYLYGNRNAGDMAICIGTIEFLKRHGYGVTMVSRFSEAEDEYQKSKDYVAGYYPDVKVYPGPFSFERDFSAVKKLVSYTGSLLKVAGFTEDKLTWEMIAEHDIVLFNGGNLLRGTKTTDYMRLMALFYPIQIAHKMGKPVYCLPQSTAKVSSFGKRQLKKYLASFRRIYVREEISYGELTKWFPQFDFVKSTDMAFQCRDTETAKKKFSDLSLKLTGKDIAVVVRNTGIGDIGYLPREKKDQLKNALLSFVYEHEDYHYWIVVQAEKDRAFSKALLSELISQADLIECYDPMLLREIYKHMEALVTMRLHAGILSLSALTPVVGIFSEEWGLKNPGIMKDYEMPYLIIENSKDDHIDLPDAGRRSKIMNNIQRNTQPIEYLFGGGYWRHDYFWLITGYRFEFSKALGCISFYEEAAA